MAAATANADFQTLLEALGPGIVLDPTEDPDPDQEFVKWTAKLVRVTIDSGRFAPPLLPEVAVELAQMASDESVEILEVERVVSRDPTVAGRVVAVANSALHSRGNPITSLQAAVMRLGVTHVRDIAFQVVAKTRVFKVRAYADRMRELFDASLACGIIARDIDRRRNMDSGTSYLCGLLHDIGEAVILGIVAAHFQQRREPVPSVERLHQVNVEYHALVGAWVCRRWKLAEPIVDAVLDHHHPERAGDPTQLARVIALADRVVEHAGVLGDPIAMDEVEESQLAALLRQDMRAVRAVLEVAEKLAATKSEWSGSAMGM